jgi:hypothetical protein
MMQFLETNNDRESFMGNLDAELIDELLIAMQFLQRKPSKSLEPLNSSELLGPLDV